LRTLTPPSSPMWSSRDLRPTRSRPARRIHPRRPPT
jgi:hypothetical protein